MTKQEFRVLMKALVHAYPAVKGQDAQAFHDLWWGFLCELDYASASAALGEHIRTVTFPPSIAEIIQGAREYEEKQIVADLLDKKRRALLTHRKKPEIANE